MLKNLRSSTSLTFFGSTNAFSRFVRNLRVLFDTSLSFDNHVNSIFLELCRISHIRYISVTSTKHLMSAFVLSRLIYSISLFIDLLGCLLDKLQKVQNNAAHTVFFMWKADHATLLLLPVRACINFKITMLCYCLVHGSCLSLCCRTSLTVYDLLPLTLAVPVHPLWHLQSPKSS